MADDWLPEPPPGHPAARGLGKGEPEPAKERPASVRLTAYVADGADVGEGEDATPDHWQPLPTDRFSVEELTTIPPAQRFVLRPYIPAAVPCLLQGAGGTSKTGLLMRLAVGITTGCPMIGECLEPGSVLIVSAEDRRDTLRRHLWAAVQDVAPDVLPIVARRVVVKDLNGLGFKLTSVALGACYPNASELQRLVAFARTIPDLRVIALDTLSRTHAGQETNEDLSRYVEGMDYLCRETGAACIAVHHVGKAQMRAEAVDQYGGRGGSALSDNCRSVLHLAAVGSESKDAPTNAGDLIAEGRLLRLSHVKGNLSSKAPDVFLQRVPTEAAARLEVFEAERRTTDPSEVWERIARWMLTQTDIAHPTAADIERECTGSAGPRAKVRLSIEGALSRGRLVEVPHPKPQGKRRHYLRLASPEASGWGADL